MSRHGHKLRFGENKQAICPESNYLYEKAGEGVKCIDLDEDKPLPEELSVGSETYDSFKS
jgi:UDP-2-acetamido-3-amino-2,3-dideoxy-glucuronate N-acetyltransferase